MDVLVVNCGSTTIKADVLDSRSGERRLRVRVERVGEPGCAVTFDGGDPLALDASGHREALDAVLPQILERTRGGPVGAIGHRVVHGGEEFSAPARIDDAVESKIESLAGLAPLHNPANLAGIRAARRHLPDATHVAVFDTAFHATLPRRARAYALLEEVVARHGIRRYGFHGTSHAWVAQRAAGFLGEPLRDLRIVTCHLGGGASVAAVEFGRSVETSMGMTPLEGLVMATRSGDIDPGVVIELARREGLDADGLDRLLNRESGLAGLSGVGPDMRDIQDRAAEGDERCRLAIHVFAHRLRKYVGAYAAVMGGVDAIVFTAGIGENSALVRHRVCQRLEFLGARLDEDRNRDARVDREHPVAEISHSHGRVRLLVVATDEEHAIAAAAAALVRGADRVADDRAIPIAISARHVHLTPEAVEALFGAGQRLEPETPLSQPGQFAAKQRVTLIGPRRSLEGVRVVGPERDHCQVEIARTDEFHLGIDAPIRCSGDVANSPGIVLEGPAGRYTLDEGVICAQRHIHMTPEDALRHGVSHKDTVEVAIDSDGRDLVFGDVVVRVSPSYRLEMHVDTDEGNAAELSLRDQGVLAATGRDAHLRRRGTALDRPAD